MTSRLDWSKRLTAVLLLICCSPFGSALAQSGPNFPNLTGRVVDQAELLSASDEQTLSEQLAEHEAQTSNQIIVVTVNSLEGYADAEYAQKLGTKWGIGTAEKNNGVVLLVAPNERKVRIEVGYGLEGALPDAIAGQIIRRNILPQFKEQDFSGGIKSGVNSILQAVVGEYKAEPQGAARKDRGFDFIPLLFIAIIAIPSLLRKQGLYRIANAAFPASFVGLGVSVFTSNIIFGLLAAAAIFAGIYIFNPNAGSAGDGSGRRGRNRENVDDHHHRHGGGGGGGGFSGGGGGFGGGGASGSW